MSLTRHIPAWTKVIIAMKKKGFSDIECCQKAGVSLEKYKTHRKNDGMFDLECEEAATIAATKGALLW